MVYLAFVFSSCICFVFRLRKFAPIFVCIQEWQNANEGAIDVAAYLIFVRNILGFVGHILVLRKCWIVCVVQLFGLFLVNTFSK